MGRPKLANAIDTKSELLNAGLILLQTKGYGAFTFQDLADQLKIKRESIHYHYPTKEALGIKIAKHAMKGFQHWIDALDKKLSPIKRLEAYFALFVVVSNDGTRICPCSALLADWGILSPKLRAATSKLVNMHKCWMRDNLVLGRRAGVIKTTESVDNQVQFIFASMVGGIQSTRAEGDIRLLKAIMRQAFATLKV